MKNDIEKSVFPHRLAAGIGMVSLSLVWAAGWFIESNAFRNSSSSFVLITLPALVFMAWNIVSGVIAAGFFHAASRHHMKSFKAYRKASLGLLIIGILFLFPVPIMALSLGNSTLGRVYSLIITGISIAAIIFGRARIEQIREKLGNLASSGKPDLAPFEEIEQLGEEEPSPKDW